MSKVTRADWAASTPWSGITDKPPAPPAGITDIGQLTGLGYQNGQYPRFNILTGRFHPATLPPTPAPTPTPGPGTFTIVSWDTPSLLPLQSAWEDFTVLGAYISQPIYLGTPFPDAFILAVATVPEANVVRITVTNMSLTTVDLGEGSWTLHT